MRNGLPIEAMSRDHAETYLARIGVTAASDASVETLTAVHVAHLVTVPFENLDIALGREIVLDLDRLYDKIVTRRRGGFCYELNGLFAALLAELGFDLDMLSARVANDAGVLGPEFDHMALLVRSEEKRWLADVGFGDSFRTPIDLDDPSPQRGGDLLGRSWSIRESESGIALVQHESDGASRIAYTFTLTPRSLAEYAPMCIYQQTSPDSHFTQRRVCTRATLEGRVTLADGRLIVTTREDRRETPVAEGDRAALLERELGVVL